MTVRHRKPASTPANPSHRLVRWLPALLIVFSLACSLPTIGRPTPTPQARLQEAVPTAPPPEPTPTQQPLPPAIVESDPAPGSEVALNEPLVLYFNQPMDPDSVEAAFSSQLGLTETVATGLEWIDDATLAISPTAGLEPDAEWTLQVDDSARSQGGQGLLQPVSLSFRTAGLLQVTQTLPEDGAAEVDPTSAVVAAFNRPVVPLGADPDGLPQAFEIETDDGEPAVGRAEWLNTSTYIFYPEPSLAGGKTYEVTLNSDLTSAAGGPLEEAVSWSFSTALPRLLSVTPGANAPLDAPVVLTFNQPMDPDSVDMNFFLTEPSGGAVGGTLEWNEDQTVFTFTPSRLLQRGSVYRVSVLGQARAGGGTPIGDTLSATLQTVPDLHVVRTDPGLGGLLDAYSSVTLFFSGPILDRNVADHIQITPEARDVFTWWNEEARSLNITALFAPQTNYTLTVSPDLADPWGGTLQTPFTMNFRTASLPPGLRVGSGAEVIFLTPEDQFIQSQATNVSALNLSLGPVPLTDLFELLGENGYMLRQQYQSPSPVNWLQTVETVSGQSQLMDLSLSPNGQPLEPGLYFLRVSTALEFNPGPFVVVVSPINLTFKISATDALVWAVDLRTNQPVSGAPVTIYDAAGQSIASGTTDDEGIFRASVPPVENPYEMKYAVVGEPGGDTFSLAPSIWSEGIYPYEFGITTDTDPPHLEAYFYTERPIYRPGQTVYFRAVVRDAYNGRYEIPDIASLPLVVSGEQGEQLASFELPLSAFGTVHGEWQIPAGARPGYYSLSSPSLEFQSFSFQVAEYRKPEINLQVALAGAGGEAGVLAGLPFTATVDARYFFDAPAGNVPVQWALYAQDEPYFLQRYQTGPQDRYWLTGGMRFPPGLYGRLVSEGTGETTPEGVLTLEFPSGQESAEDATGQRQRYTLEVTATDESGQPVSARGTIDVHPAEVYIGVRPDSWVSRAGDPAGYEVQVANWDGSSSGVHRLRAEYARVTWRRVDRPLGAYALPSFEPEFEVVGSTDFSTSDQGQARLAFTPPEPGNYQLTVTGLDEGNRNARTELTTWVTGPGQAQWPNLANQRLQLTAGRTEYLPGETAQVFIPNPYPGPVLALLTTERAIVMSHQILSIPAGGLLVDLPLTAEDAPNIIVSANLIGQESEGQPSFRMGYLNLDVEPVEQYLNVALTSEPERLGPGEDVTFQLRVTDMDGSPVTGEFSLSVVDLAVLALADPNSQDIVPAFYSRQGLGVRTNISLSAYANREMFTVPGGGGGGGDAAAPYVRERFLDTAYWNAEIVTDENGEASLTVPLPDSLTTWQVDVRGVTAGTQVGQAEAQVITTRDLIVRPVTPRFVIANDHMRLAAVVQNNTTGPLEVTASLQATGFVLDDPALESQPVSVEPEGRERVEWWGTVQDVDEVGLVFSASASNGLQDASGPSGGPLPVLRYSVPETFRTSGVLEEPGEVLELVSLPRSFDPAAGGGLNVQLAPSLAAALVDALEALEHQPYECTEQTLSRFLPNLVTYRTLQEAGIQDAALKARLDRTLANGVQRLLTFQNYDGGWSWWPSLDQVSHPYVSAYVLFGLTQAQAAGLQVDQNALTRAVSYVQTTLPDLSAGEETWQLDRLAFAHFVLAQAGAGDETGVMATWGRQEQLSPWAQALLALTLEEVSPGSQQATTLISNLESAAVRSATGASWEAGELEDWQPNMVSSVTNTAIVVYALARQDASTPLVADAVRFLMAHRQADGAWGSTYSTAWTILAVNEVLKGTGELGGSFAFSATLNGAPLVSGQAGGAGQLNPVEAGVPLENLHPQAPNALSLERGEGDGRLYYTAALNLSRPVEEVQPLEKGLAISRSYEPLSAGEDEEAATDAETPGAPAGERVLVRLALTLPNDAYYLVVEDYIPGGAEIVNTQLKTTQYGEFGEPVVTAEYDPRSPFSRGWGWWLFNEADIYDDHISWTAEFLPAGTYELTYTMVGLQPGEYRVLPARAWEFYFPEVQGHSAGEVFEIR